MDPIKVDVKGLYLNVKVDCGVVKRQNLNKGLLELVFANG
jgi:hypothetical protein